MIPITTQTELDNLLSSINWGDAFIKEIHLHSPSYITSDPNRGIYAWDCSPTVGILVCTLETKCQGIEFILTEVENLNLTSCADLSPKGRFFRTYVALSFGERDQVMRAKQLAYRFLNGRCCDDNLDEYFNDNR